MLYERVRMKFNNVLAGSTHQNTIRCMNMWADCMITCRFRMSGDGAREAPSSDSRSDPTVPEARILRPIPAPTRKIR